MKLRARLSLISAVVTTVSTLVVGGIAITSQHGSQIALIDKSLAQVVSSVKPTTNAALSEALFAVQQSDLALTLVYFTDPSSPLVLNESNLSEPIDPTKAEIKAAFSRPITHDGAESYRLRGIELQDGEYILIAATLKDVESRFASDRLHLFIFIFICLLIAAFITWFFFRRDIRKIESLIASAEAISLGQSQVEIEVEGGDSEIDQLAAALNRMVATLRRTAETEERASQRMQDFLGDASHELRTPLTVIKGYIELLAGTRFTDADQRKKAFSRLSSEISRMESLINDLLFLAESGTSREIDLEIVNLSQLLLSHAEDFREVDSRRTVDLEIGSSISMAGSAPLLSRLLTNIFSNISRHTPSDAPVRVSLSQSTNRLHLRIEDGGPGLPTSAYENGLQNFQRFDKSRSREAGGSGLGMSIIFAIVQELSGEIHLSKSELGGLAIDIYFDKLVA